MACGLMTSGGYKLIRPGLKRPPDVTPHATFFFV
jgi:hypothetical protein